MFTNNEQKLNTPTAYQQPVCRCVELCVERAVLEDSNGGKPGDNLGNGGEWNLGDE